MDVAALAGRCGRTVTVVARRAVARFHPPGHQTTL